MNGKPPMSNFSTIGSSMSSGRKRRASATFARTSCAATSMSLSSSNSTVTIENPSMLAEVSWRIPPIVLICSSIGSVTSWSMTSGLAPTSTVWTVTIGNSTSGKASTPIRVKASQPKTTRAAISVRVVTGRRIEVSESHMAAISRARRRGPGRTAGWGAAREARPARPPSARACR